MTLHATRGGAGLGACSRRCCASGADLEAAELASQIRATDDDEAWPLDLWRTYLCSTIGLPLAVVAAQPSTRCGCARWYLDAYGDHVSTCKNHTGAAKAYDWACEWLAAWFRSTGTKVKTQRAVTAVNGEKWDPHKYRELYRDRRRQLDFLPAFASTSGRIHCELLRLLFLHAHRETARFFEIMDDEHAQPHRHI